MDCPGTCNSWWFDFDPYSNPNRQLPAGSSPPTTCERTPIESHRNVGSTNLLVTTMLFDLWLNVIRNPKVEGGI